MGHPDGKPPELEGCRAYRQNGATAPAPDPTSGCWRGRTPKSAHLTFLARWPSRKAIQHARDRIREITARQRLLVPAEVIVTELNLFLRGWAGYFRYGNSARALGQIRNHAFLRLALWLSKKGNRRLAWGWGIKQVLLSPDHLGLIILDRTVIPPRPFRPWRGQAERRR